MELPSTRILARAALWSWLAAGTFDILAAIVLNLRYPARTILQSVASGWLGADAYSGGWPTAWLGLASHFGIMLVIAVIWTALAATRPHLRTRWIGAGLAWGGVVWFVMTFIVVPLSASPLPTPGAWKAIQGVLTHVVAVGLPMALITRRVLGLPVPARPAPSAADGDAA